MRPELSRLSSSVSSLGIKIEKSLIRQRSPSWQSLFCGIVGVVLVRVAADQKPHSVLLKWDPPPKPGFAVAGYNVYRSPADGRYEPIASVAATTYTDRGVRNGETYHYLVKAVDAKGTRARSPIRSRSTIQ